MRQALCPLPRGAPRPAAGGLSRTGRHHGVRGLAAQVTGAGKGDRGHGGRGAWGVSSTPIVAVLGWVRDTRELHREKQAVSSPRLLSRRRWACGILGLHCL